ncbi:hypothetical protein NADFUDRAFT_49441 [Nadsonia fulvescens var. elongata DSM 6958]|uniref:C2H2-type domain-containing protein n=1 Tax=Nadsonia fulvescens var. elongata DSM 6958 TaxID=857566 RepID=A0A1E3PNI0_9ASCO|nr:hypothetical protein NADFUDRAFT_49441 [Nadsonia fulvescens var. elongata DSM 6958]
MSKRRLYHDDDCSNLNNDDEQYISSNYVDPGYDGDHFLPLIKTARPDGNFQVHVISCHLPPNCDKNHVEFSSYSDYESHYNSFHSFCCLECNCVFPSSRFLDLHLTEHHDPLTAIKNSRGDRTFSCFISSCKTMSISADERKSHLINDHYYPNNLESDLIRYLCLIVNMNIVYDL